MSMYDTIRFLTPHPALVCPEGHPVREFQTKDLDNNLTAFFVQDNRLYAQVGVKGRFEEEETGCPVGQLQADGSLILIYRYPAIPDTRSAELEIYQSCSTCRPVLSFSQMPSHGLAWSGGVVEHVEYTDWMLTLTKGVVESIQRIKGRTRAEKREELLRRGLDVLDDNDRLARRHFNLRARR